MTAGVYDMRIEKGATFTKVLTLKDSDRVAVNITGYTARSQFRKSSTSVTPFVDLTTENGGISIDGANGQITLTISAINTAAIDEIKGIYDLELVNGTDVTKLLNGSVTIIEETTK